ncbi:dienelactone hydrolase family protein [Thalassotalea atypica]|uniref:dienelactone hydrolase family protein n=1 Tax=Thalassotalea atypica TaxID=2054316 RepID=UPI0025722E79|nr:alpha/beta hydrolase [Thalassotalea atypica]
MNLITKSVAFAAFTISLAAQAAPVTLSTAEGFDLKADYFQSKAASNRAVLMLHQCNYNRSMYDNIGKKLAKKNIHALSLDFKGFGESVSAEYDVEKLQKLPDDQRRKAWGAMSKSWPSDVQQAYDYLKNKAGDNAIIGVVGASCGGSQAITLAENNDIKAISFFSSGQREKNINRYVEGLADKATLIIAAADDGGTYTSAQTLFASAKHADSKFIAYKSGGHGYPLLDKDKSLAKVIAQWFNSQL